MLEQNNRAGRNQQGKQDTQTPTGSCGGKDKGIGGNADAEGADRTHEDDVEGEQKTGNSGTVKTGKHDHIRGKGHRGKQGQNASGKVERFLRRIEHTNAYGAEQNAEETADPGLFPQEKDLADDDEGRVSEVKHGCWTRGDKLVGRKQQDRCQAAAQQGDQCDLWKQRKWDLQGFLLPVCQNAQRQEREHIAQKHKRERGHAIGVDIFCHQRHGTVNDCAYDGESASLQGVITHESSLFRIFLMTDYTIVSFFCKYVSEGHPVTLLLTMLQQFRIISSKECEKENSHGRFQQKRIFEFENAHRGSIGQRSEADRTGAAHTRL